MTSSNPLQTCPGGGIGRRWRLKIFCPALGVPVQVRPRAPFLQLLLALFAALVLTTSVSAAPAKLPTVTYPFADQGEYWVNSAPLADHDLRGKPVLIFFWTFGCYNCRNSLKWINSVQARYADKGLLILGVHTPEFPHEQETQAVVTKTHEYGMKFPVMIDNEYIFWRDMQNNWWPAFYLYDGYGQLQGSYVGETHLDTPKAAEIEGRIDNLLDS